MYFVYILYSTSADKYYVGQTPDMERRMVFHNELGMGYTSKHRPWELKRAFEVANASIATRVERYIKMKKSRTFVEQLITDGSLWDYVIQKCSVG
jgi:putative endonuclease